MKGKLDADKLKELCLNNFEKAIFGVLVLFFLMMALSALKVKPYDKKPEQLSSSCNQAKAKLDEVQEVQPVTRNYDSLVIGIQEELPGTDYVTAIPWNPILSKESQKRKKPQILTVQNLVVKEWHGSVQKPQKLNDMEAPEETAFDDGLGGGRTLTTEGVRCCILIGELPFAEQELEFQKKLGIRSLSAQMQNMGMNGMESGTDTPLYYNYAVERAEIPEDGDIEKIRPEDWIDLRRKNRGKLSVNEQKIIYFNGGNEMGRGGGGMDLPEKYRPPELWRYASMETEKADKSGKNKNASAIKAPKTPRMTTMMDPNGMMANGLIQAKDASLMVPLPNVQASAQTQFNWNTYLPYPEDFELELTTMDGRRLRRPKKDDAPNAEEQDLESNDEDVADDDDEEELETVDESMMGMENSMDQAKVRLFRYVDYTVKEGKQYVYRVKVQLHNPNYQYEPPFNVEDPEDRKGKYLESAWSNTSLPVTIPLDNHFYLSGFVKKYTEDVKEKKLPPYLSLMPVRFNEISGNEDFTSFNEVMSLAVEKKAKKAKSKRTSKKEPAVRLEPGQLLNLYVYEDAIRQLGNMEMGRMPVNPRRFADEEEDEDRPKEIFQTGFILLDVRGGKELYKPLDKRDKEGAAQQILTYPDGIYSPAMVLLMGPKGELVIQSELEDVQNVYRRRDPVELNPLMNETVEPIEDLDAPGKKKKGKKVNRLQDEMPPGPRKGRGRL